MNRTIIEYENLKLSNQAFFNEYKKSFSNFLDSGWYILGKQVEEFEKKYSTYCTTSSAIGVASGLDALILAINAFDFPTGSEIIVPSNTYIATIMAVVRNGFKPVLVEPNLNTYNIDPNLIEEKINNNTRAIIAVHLYGKCCNMEQIEVIAAKYSLEVIEDVAQAQGAKYKDKIAGSFGVGCHSFYPTKNLGALGDSGAITVNDDVYAAKIKMLRNYGSSVKYHNSALGYNSRLDEVQACFLSVKLNYLNKINEHKRKLAKLYLENLSSEYIKPVVDDDFYDVYHIFNIRHSRRDEIKEYLLSNGVKTEVHYPIPPHKQKSMSGILSGEYSISEEIHATTLSLPISFYHTEDDIFRVIEELNKWVK